MTILTEENNNGGLLFSHRHVGALPWTLLEVNISKVRGKWSGSTFRYKPEGPHVRPWTGLLTCEALS